MKKNLLILALCLLGTLPVNAATWVAIDSGNPDIQMFIDSDSIKYLSTDTCTYALIYKKGNEHTRVIYAVSNYSKDYVGMVRVEDFEPDKYNPSYYSKHPRAFMKKIENNKILSGAHNYALSLYEEKKNNTSGNGLEITNMKNVNNFLPSDNYGYSDEAYNNYIDEVKSSILKNWKTSIKTSFTNVSLIISINPDGSYNGYRILSSSKNEDAQRAAIAAVNLTAPFAPLPENSLMNSGALNFKITFDQKLFRKSIK